MKRLFFKVFVCLVIAALVLGGLALAAYLSQIFPSDAASAVDVTVDKWITWKGGRLKMTGVVQGLAKPDEETTKAVPADVLLILDVSSSMGSSNLNAANIFAQTPESPLDYLKHAAALLTYNLAGADVRFAVVTFTEGAGAVVPFTNDKTALVTAIAGIDGGGGTSFYPPFVTALQVLDTARPAPTRRMVLFFSDGDANDISEAAAVRREISDRYQAEVYAIASGDASVDHLIELVDDATRVMESPEAAEIGTALFQFGRSILTPSYSGAVAAAQIDPQDFRIETSTMPFMSAVDAQEGSVLWNLPAVFETPLELPLEVAAIHAGLHALPSERLRFDYVDNKSGEAQTIRAVHKPRVLVLSWFFLLWFILPALLLPLLHQLLQKLKRPQQRIIEPPPHELAPQGYAPPDPPAIPRLGRKRDFQPNFMPTLVVGIGDAGNAVLRHMNADLRAENGDSAWRDRVRFLSINSTEARPPRPDSRGADDQPAELRADETAALSERARRLAPIIDQLRISPDRAPWFDPQAYLGRPAAELDLASGTGLDRRLARLGLWAEFNDPESALVSRIEQALATLLDAPAIAGRRRVVIVANPDGGTGSGWFTDIAAMIRLVCRKRAIDEGGDSAAVEMPEIIGLLAAPVPTNISAEKRALAEKNRNSLLSELDNTAFAGLFRQPALTPPSWGAPESCLDEAPLDQIYFLQRSGQAKDNAVAEAATFLSTFLDVDVSASLAPALRGNFVSVERTKRKRLRASFHSAGCQTVQYPVGNLRERIEDLFLFHGARRFLARGDGVCDVDASGERRPIERAAIIKTANEFAAGPPTGSAPEGFAAFWSAISDPNKAGSLLAWIGGWDAQFEKERLPQLLTSYSECLITLVAHHVRMAHWTLGEATEALRLAAKELNAKRREYTAGGNDSKAAESRQRIFDQLVKCFEAAADGVEAWRDLMIGMYKQGSERFAGAVAELNRLSKTPCRKILDERFSENPPADASSPDYKLISELLQRWSNSNDWRMTLIERTWLEPAVDRTKLQLAMMGDAKKTLRPDSIEKLINCWIEFGTQWSETVWDKHVARKLLELYGDTDKIAAQAPGWLPRSQAASSIGIAPSVQFNYLVLPDLYESRDLLRAIADRTRANMQPYERLEVVHVPEYYALRMLSIVPDVPTDKLRYPANEESPNRTGQQYLQFLGAKLATNLAVRSVVLHPFLGLCVSDPSKFSRFAEEWVRSRVSSDPIFGITWTRPNQPPVLLAGPGEGLAVACARFVSMPADQLNISSADGPPIPDRLATLIAESRQPAVDSADDIERQILLLMWHFVTERPTEK